MGIPRSYPTAHSENRAPMIDLLSFRVRLLERDELTLTRSSFIVTFNFMAL
jgi:hypothetical protein